MDRSGGTNETPSPAAAVAPRLLGPAANESPAQRAAETSPEVDSSPLPFAQPGRVGSPNELRAQEAPVRIVGRVNIRSSRLLFWALLVSCMVIGAAALLFAVYTFIMLGNSDNIRSTSAVGTITVSAVIDLSPSPVTPSTMIKKASTAASTPSSSTGNAATKPTPSTAASTPSSSTGNAATNPTLLGQDTRFPFICTFNIFRYKKGVPVPDDGICDLILLDSLYRNNKYTFFRQSYYNNWTQDVKDFIGLKSVYKKTKIGLGFDAYNDLFQSEFATSNSEDSIKRFYSSTNISYFGLVDMDTDSYDVNNTFTRAIYPLKVIQTAYEDAVKMTDDYGVILAITPPKRFLRLLKVEEDFGLFIRPTVLTALGHTSYVNYAQPHYNDSVDVLKGKLADCVIIPPSVYEPLKGSNILPYTHTLKEAVDFLDTMRTYLGNCKPNETREFVYAVSVTLKARWFTTRNDSKAGLFEKCDNVTSAVDVNPYSVCSSGAHGQYRYDPAYKSGIFSNSTHALTVETEQSIKAKLCSVKAEFIDTNYGVAVYDIDADMDKSACDKVEYTGQYKRLKLIRKINDFMKAYTKKSMKSQCENL
ncbi:uncharacterized protein [Dermacentor albipictus]|uniref:uncharacterized protein isoform X8 n=1 Tax=Dermacentor albipictus TaxID=60249 RepID=UPI0038FCE4B9